jgi:hypothetical protein
MPVSDAAGFNTLYWRSNTNRDGPIFGMGIDLTSPAAALMLKPKSRRK